MSGHVQDAPWPSEPSIDVKHLIATARIGKVQIRVVILCALLVLLDGLDSQIVGYLGPALAREWRLSSAALGQLFSAGLAGMMLGLLVIGPLADRLGRKRVIALSAALLGAATMLMAVANGPAELLAYRVVAGLGLGGTLPNALALTGDYSPDRWRATLVVVMFTGFSIGSILGGGLTAALVLQHGWRPIFALSGLLPLLLAPVLYWTLPESPHTLVRDDRGSTRLIAFLRRVNPDRPVPAGARLCFAARRTTASRPRQLFQDGRRASTVLLWIACSMSLMEIYFLQTWLPTILTDAGLGMMQAVLTTTAFFAGGIMGGFLSAPLMDRLGSPPVLVGLFAGGAVAIPLIGLHPAMVPAAIATTFLAGFCAGGGQKGLNALAVILYPAPIRSTGLAWALGAGRIGAIIGPVAVGWLLDRGWPTGRVFLAAALPMLGAAAAMLLLATQHARSADSGEQAVRDAPIGERS